MTHASICILIKYTITSHHVTSHHSTYNITNNILSYHIKSHHNIKYHSQWHHSYTVVPGQEQGQSTQRKTTGPRNRTKACQITPHMQYLSYPLLSSLSLSCQDKESRPLSLAAVTRSYLTQCSTVREGFHNTG